MKQSSDPNKQLFQIAESQRGLFTASQAERIGFVQNNHAYHVKQGHWSKVDRGIYRYTLFPYDPEEQLVHYALWSRNREGIPQGVYSHETALKHYDLSDLDSKKIHMTVPKSFRRNSKIPKVLELHFGNIAKEEIKESRGFKVTSPLKTLRDIIEGKSVSFDFVEQAMKQAIARGLVRKAQFHNFVDNLDVADSIKKDVEVVLKGMFK